MKIILKSTILLFTCIYCLSCNKTSINYNEYGLGLRIINVNGSEIIYHSGSTIGTKTLLLFSSDLKICLLFLTNFNDFNGTTLKEVLVEYLEKEHSL